MFSSEKVDALSRTIDVGGWTPQVYFVQVKVDNQFENQKFIKM